MNLCNAIRGLQNRLADQIGASPAMQKELERAADSMLHVEHVWTDYVRRAMR
jgi:hypothetical protein